MTINHISQQLLVSNDYLSRLAYSLTKNQEDAHDLLQDTRFKVLSKWYQFREGTNFQAWAHTIMRNLFINNYRKQKNRERYLSAYSAAGTSKGILKGHTLDFPLVQEKIFEEINQLSPNLKAVIIMAMEGYRYDEIAQELQLPIGTVKSRIHLSRKQLKNKLSKLELI